MTENVTDSIDALRYGLGVGRVVFLPTPPSRTMELLREQQELARDYLNRVTGIDLSQLPGMERLRQMSQQVLNEAIRQQLGRQIKVEDYYDAPTACYCSVLGRMAPCGWCTRDIGAELDPCDICGCDECGCTPERREARGD